jgi:HK97 family phage prohead protease
MLIRTKGGEFTVRDRSVLLEFLSEASKGRSEELGVGPAVRRSVKEDIELVASVPFCLAAGGGESSNAVPWTFSTFDLDRFDERIDPAGWDFKQFLKNPVIEWAHCYDIPAIGKAEGIYADEKGLHGTIVFNDKVFDPFGWSIGERVKAGVIRAGSVGFRVLEIEIPDTETGKDGTSLIFRKQELLEFSICNVPANPAALAKRKNGKQDKRTISKDWSSNSWSPNFWGNIIHNLEGVKNG